MLTFFTTAKPFQGHSAVIQRNALKSWTLLDPDVEVILFGDDEGAAEVCKELGLRHEFHVERHESGMKYLDYMFSRAQQIARHDTLCYVNCDIILMSSLRRALEQVEAAHPRFLMVGNRWNVDITSPLVFDQPDWEENLRALVLHEGYRLARGWIDYFVFSRGAYGPDLPPFVIGRVYWDNWLIWKALRSKLPVVDISPVAMAVHQNHDYNYHPQGERGVWEGEEAKRNLRLAGGWGHMCDVADATEVLWPDGLKPNRKRYGTAVRRHAKRFWMLALDVTRPVRHVLGLRSKAMRQSGQKV
ncbi:MAG: hypothetical protein ABSF92_13070 [Candidatus Acidiferrales bacterium]|jgi:hypothetical protein